MTCTHKCCFRGFSEMSLRRKKAVLVVVVKFMQDESKYSKRQAEISANISGRHV